MNDQYWIDYWTEHAHSTAGENPQCRVLRTQNKRPVDGVVFDRILTDIVEKLRLQPDDTLLDLCCGNGLITVPLATRCKSVVGVDFTKELLAEIDLSKQANLRVIHADANEVDFPKQSFSKILMYAGIQYLSHQQVVNLVSKISSWLRPGGEALIGDVPDEDRMWNFFNSRDREKAYFDALRVDQPIVGTWIRAEWFTKLGTYCGFNEINILPQPDTLPYAHFRYDIRLQVN